MFTDPAVLSCPATQAPAKLTGRVMFALSRAEWQLFFPQYIRAEEDMQAHADWADGGVELVRWSGNGSGIQGPAGFAEALARLKPDVLVSSWSTPAIPNSVLAADGPNRTVPAYVCHTTGSVKHLFTRAYLERGGLVTNWGTLASQAVAEHALMLTLSSLRRMPEWAPVIAGKRPWQPSPIYTQTLYGKRVGLHGMGNVARALSLLLRPFGVKLSAWSGGVPAELYSQAGIPRAASLEELFANSDVVIDCEALTPRTAGIVSMEILQQMPQGALFVNVGRGLVVDEHALAELAGRGRIRIALDVFSKDPITPNSPLHSVEDAVLSPHIAGPTSDQFARCGELVMRNLEAYFTGLPLEAVVTLEMWDRST
ncbi:MAG TPA: hydroxyacid dehydrogenase [Candidatus Methylacidiphilales bacterium]|nr:hydroxyacid dehydrogenase [Candidatus Methylacidiphilales bacterium]